MSKQREGANGCTILDPLARCTRATDPTSCMAWRRRRTSKDALVEAGLATLQDVRALGDAHKINETVARLKAVADAAGKKRAAVGQSTLNSLIT